MKKALKIGVLVSLTGAVACSSDDAPNGGPPGVCVDKCDDTTGAPLYQADLRALQAQFRGAEATRLEDFYTVTTRLGPQSFVSPTHVFVPNAPINVIPYADEDTRVTAADGTTLQFGDEVIAYYFKPGDIGIGLKHHRPSHRELDLSGGGGTDELKEHFKFQDTHIEIVVGVRDDRGRARAMTLNNPQTYQDGRFGDASYPMVFLRPAYPDYLSADTAAAFRDNIRTMVLGFNAVTNFPGDYNGGDPLGARDVARVGEHVKQMILAILGDSSALAYFQDDANQVYCAELAYLSMTAGSHYPLNRATFRSLGLTDANFEDFREAIAKHNAGERTGFTELNENEFARFVEGAMAPENLRPMPSYAPAEHAADADRLALAPMTMADIIQQFMAGHIRRDVMGEGVAPAQAALLTALKPGLIESMGLDRVPAAHPSRVAVDNLFDRLVATVGTSHADYATFQAALAPLMAEARGITGPRDGSGNGLFVPPHLFHLTALGRVSGGLLGLSYVGHGIHISQTRRGERVAPPTPPAAMSVILDESATIDRLDRVYFDLTVPEGQFVRVDLAVSEGDADLYARAGSEDPNTRTYDYRSDANGTTTDTFELPAGTWRLMVRGVQASTFRLTANVIDAAAR